MRPQPSENSASPAKTWRVDGVVEGDVAQRMAGRADDEKRGGAERHHIVGRHSVIESEDLFGLGARPGDGDVEVGLQHRQAFDVVAVVVGDEDVGQRPAAMVEGGLDGAGIGRIDRGGLARFDVVHEIAVIVGAAEKQIDEDGQDDFAPATRRGMKNPNPQTMPIAMTPDVKRLISFYKSPLGKISRALVREEVMRMAGSIDKRRVLGLGFATPYLRFSLEKAERVLAFMPARQGSSAWPREGPSHTVLCDPLEMPLTDSAVDLIIAVHAFEHTADAEELMREIWRVSAPNARLIVVVPRRRGMWAAADNTPFGDGNPFSRSQLEQAAARAHSSCPSRGARRCYLPPINHRLVAQVRALLRTASGGCSGRCLPG